MLQRVAVCCSVLQCVAVRVCCSVLQCVLHDSIERLEDKHKVQRGEQDVGAPDVHCLFIFFYKKKMNWSCCSVF